MVFGFFFDGLVCSSCCFLFVSGTKKKKKDQYRRCWWWWDPGRRYLHTHTHIQQIHLQGKKTRNIHSSIHIFIYDDHRMMMMMMSWFFKLCMLLLLYFTLLFGFHHECIIIIMDRVFRWSVGLVWFGLSFFFSFFLMI